MKTLVLILLVVVAGVLAHNYVQTGEIGFNVSVSEEKRQIMRLEDRLSDAVAAYRVAGRGTSIGGMAPDSGVETAAAEVERIEREVESLEERIRQGDDLYPDLLGLKRKLGQAKREVGIP